MNISLGINDILALSPWLIILAAGLVILLLESFIDTWSKKFAGGITIVAIILAIGAAYFAPISYNPLLTPWLRFDSLAKFYIFFFLLIGFGTSLLAISFFQRFSATHGEYFFLLLSALFGLMMIGASADFLTLFLGIETLSLSLYVLCGYMKHWKTSRESAIKYFFMGSLAAGFLLYGIALVYGAIGTTRFDALAPAYQMLSAGPDRILFLSGITLVTLALAFEAAIVPFQVWAPDVYDAAPTPVTAFMAVGTKAGAFAAFSIIFFLALPRFDILWNQFMSLLAYITLIYANFVALRQVQMRRFFAYSGISHAGFLLIPLIAGTPDALSALLFYLVVYAFATLGAFGVLANLDQGSEGVKLKDLYGLFYQQPFLAVALTICFLTLAGIPPTIGFFAKFYLFKVAYEADYIGLIMVGLLTTILSAYYYLRFIAVMFSHESHEIRRLTYLWPAALIATISCLLLLAFSIFPEPLLQFVFFMKSNWIPFN